MNILHVIYSLRIGGAESMLIDILNKQSKSNEVNLIVINDLYERDLLSTINKTVNVYLLNRKPSSYDILSFIKFNRIIRNINPNIIHVHNENIVKLILGRRIPVFVTIHDTMVKLNNLNSYKKIFAISNAVKKYILDNSRINNNKIFIIPNGIEINRIVQKTDYSYNVFRIIQVGRLNCAIKGQNILIKALKILIDKGYNNIHIDFIGSGESLSELLDEVDNLSLNNYVTFCGIKNRDYVYSHLKDYNLFVQPSIYEGFGLTVAEAMAAKVPVLVSNIEGPMEIISNGEYGSFFKTKDFHDCAANIERIIINYNDIIKNNDKAYDYVAKNYSINSTAQRYIDNYN